MDPFYEMTHHAASEAMERAARIVRSIEHGEPPEQHDVEELARAAEDVWDEFLDEQEA